MEQAKLSLWSKLDIWLYVFALIYAIVATVQSNLTHLGFGLLVVVCLRLGRLSGYFDTASADVRRPYYKVDYALAPLISIAVTTFLALAFHLPRIWIPVAVVCYLVGYCADAPWFGTALSSFFSKWVLPAGALCVALAIVAIVAVSLICDWIAEHKQAAAFRMRVICGTMAYGTMIWGWITGNVSLAAIGLGFMSGQFVTASGQGFQGFILATASVISVVCLAGHTVAPSDPMYAVAAGFIALILTTRDIAKPTPVQPPSDRDDLADTGY